jgi:predicted O-methyltransferase YrrM
VHKDLLVNLVERLPIPIAQRLRDQRVRWQIKRMARQINDTKPSELGIELLAVLNDVAQSRSTAEEQTIFSAIEAYRLALLADDGPIERLDYGVLPDGASDPERGVPIKTTIGKVARASKSAPWGELLFHLVRRRRPMHVLEMGTCVGMSASYIAAALELNGRGRLVTIEGASSVAAIARDTFQRLGYTDRVEVVEGPFHRSLAPTVDAWAPLDFAFIDGHHDGQATIEYYNSIRACSSPSALLVFDDIQWSASMREAWSMIVAADPLAVTVDLGDVGIVQKTRGPASAEN